MYSAIKVNGQKLVDLARRGVEVERKPRKVEFSEIIIKEIDLPRIRFSVTCRADQYSFVRPLDAFYMDLPAMNVWESLDKAVFNGNSFRVRGTSSQTEPEFFRIYSSDGTFIGIYRKEGRIMKPEKMFYSPVQQ